MLHDAQNQQWLLFERPIAILTAHSWSEVVAVLEAVQQQVEECDRYAAGFVSYEAAPALDGSLPTQPMTGFPLVWFGIYAQPHVISLPDVTEQLTIAWQPSISEQQYAQAIHQIKYAIAQGFTYQVNFSLRLHAPFCGDPWRYFLYLNQAQNGLYSAFIDLEDWAICCASPELFFQWQGQQLISRPMKGTAPRGLTYEGDRQIASALYASEKNRAENVMIVDMIRNDMGRIARTGSVAVPELFTIEQYPTLWQMTSLVTCETQATFVDIMQAMFPCASITGAPKARTMNLIANLEDSPRRIYTGTIGFLAPQRRAQFNVAIRTVLIDKAKKQAEYGVGGGIVWDSIILNEYEECCTKAKVLTQTCPPFSLLESLLWTPEDGYFLLDFHLQRLQQSATYFAFSINLEQVEEQLAAIAKTLPDKQCGDRYNDQSSDQYSNQYKVRLQLSKAGTIYVEAMAIPAVLTPVTATLAAMPVRRSDVFLYHKTTHRFSYEQAKATSPEVEDVLLWNEDGELTEFCYANLVVELDGNWYTPPVECGLLAGTFRAWLLQQGKVKERIIHRDELPACSRIWWVNSVRQQREVILSPLVSHTPASHEWAARL